MLKTIENLLSNIDSPLEFVKPLGKLFSQFNSRSSRQLLCEIFQKLAQLEPSFGQVATIVTQLNAWDRKKIEEPDYASRIDGFEAATRLVSDEGSIQSETPSNAVSSGCKKLGQASTSKQKTTSSKNEAETSQSRVSVTVDQILPILHNCLYFVHRSDDMAIRDGAVSCVNAIVQRVVRLSDEGEFKELVVNCILPSCKLAMKGKSEVRIERYLIVLYVECKH